MRIVVLGAGIVGASAAYHLTRLGAEVYLIDRDAPGRATFAGAGIICPWLSQVRDPRYERLSFAAAEYYPKLVAELATIGEIETEYDLVGGLVVSESAGELEAIVRRLREYIDRGVKEIGEVCLLNSGGPKKRFPYLDSALAGVYLSGAARVSGEMFRAALCKAAIKADTRRLLGTAELETSGASVVGVRVNGEYIPSDTVIVAAGAWAPELCQPLGIDLAVEPQRGQIVHLKVPETDTGTLPIILPALSDYYLLGFPDSRVVIGATRETGSGFDFRVTAGGVTEVLQEGFRIAPALRQATLAEVRVGFRPVSKDGLPLVGRIPAVSGLVIATGLGSYGLTVGPYVGLLAAQLAVEKTPEQALTGSNRTDRCKSSRNLTFPAPLLELTCHGIHDLPPSLVSFHASQKQSVIIREAMANSRCDRQPNGLQIKLLGCGRAANASAVLATSMFCNLRGFLGWTSREMLSNRVCEITHEPLVDFGFSQCSPLRLPSTLVRVSQTFFLMLLDSLRLHQDPLAFVSLSSAIPLENDRLEFAILSRAPCHRCVSTWQELEVI